MIYEIVIFIAIVILIIISFIILKNKNNYYKFISKCNSNKDISDLDFKLVNAEQTFNNINIEIFFLRDIYLDEKTDTVNYSILQKNYMELFIKSINSILVNKQKYIDNYNYLDKKESISLPFYRQCIKFGKFTALYNNYLNNLDMDYLSLEINKYYPNFNKDELYFIKINDKDIHIIDILRKSFLLYKSEYRNIDRCIYYNKCYNI